MRDCVEMQICAGYLLTDAAPPSDIQLIGFRKFRGRFSAFLMSSSRDALRKLVRWYFCGRLKELLEPAVIENAAVPGVRIKQINWTVKDFDRCNQYFLVRERLLSSDSSSPSPLLSSSIDFSKVTIGIAT